MSMLILTVYIFDVNIFHVVYGSSVISHCTDIFKHFNTVSKSVKYSLVTSKMMESYRSFL